jgi:hypothetical protein
MGWITRPNSGGFLIAAIRSPEWGIFPAYKVFGLEVPVDKFYPKYGRGGPEKRGGKRSESA